MDCFYLLEVWKMISESPFYIEINYYYPSKLHGFSYARSDLHLRYGYDGVLK